MSDVWIDDGPLVEHDDDTFDERSIERYPGVISERTQQFWEAAVAL